jgi:hypothetical protein
MNRENKFYRRILTNILAASKSNLTSIEDVGRKCVSFGGTDLDKERQKGI